MGTLAGHSKLTAVLALALVGGFPLAAVALSPPAGDQAAVAFPPTWNETRILSAVAEADARLVRYAAAPGLVVVSADPAAQARLRAAGAWLVADPVLAGGCFTSTDPQAAAPGAAYSRSVS